MVDDGEIVLAPPLTLTAPIVGLIEAEVAFEDDQEIVELLPGLIEVGLAVKVQLGTGGVAVTVTDAEQVAVPPAPITVIV